MRCFVSRRRTSRDGGRGWRPPRAWPHCRFRTARSRSRRNPTCGRSRLPPFRAPPSPRRSAGAIASAAGSRSLRVISSQLRRLWNSMWRGSGGSSSLSRCASAANTAAVETGDAGIDQHQPQRREIRHDRQFVADAARDQRLGGEAHRQVGAERPADPRQLRVVESSRQSRASARSAAAASLDPPPMPDATGRFFSSVIATGGALREPQVRRAARRGPSGPDCCRRAAPPRRYRPVTVKLVLLGKRRLDAGRRNA